MGHPLPKAGILDIKPYVGGEGRVEGVTRLVRLASNENVLGCSALAREAYLSLAQDLHRYPDGSALALRAALGKAHDMNPDNIVCGAGSEELISLLVRSYAGAGDEIIYSQYGFLMYPICTKAVGATGVCVPEKDMRTDAAAMQKAVTPKTKMVLLANPNNPTGSYLNASDMRRLVTGIPSHVMILLDAAYAEFVQEKDYEDGRALVDEFPNVVMLRTFSKIYGLAGLRLGWAYGHADVVGVINRVRGAFNVGAPAQAAGVAALNDADFIKRTLDMANEGRAYLFRELARMGVHVYPSVCNFILVRFGDKAEQIRIALRDRGIFIRQMGAYGLSDCLRITVGTSEDNAQLVDALDEILKV